MMSSSNPVLSRNDTWASTGGYTPADQNYGQPPASDPRQQQAPRDPGLMTLDDVITKTAVMIGIVVVTAIATFMFVPPQLSFGISVVAGIGTFVIAFIVGARRIVPVPLALVFAALEGLFVGVISRAFETFADGIVVQAVVATMIAAGVTLVAYKFFNIKVSATFRKVVTIATIAIAVVMLVNFLFVLIGGTGIGIRAGVTGPVGILPWLFSIVAVILAVFNLVMDFDHVERGIKMRAPANQSWKAAFGLTVTLVWLYIELLRIISYFRR